MALKDHVADKIRELPIRSRLNNDWNHMAFRDAAITVWDFLMLLRAIKTLLQKSSTLRANFHMSVVEASITLYQETFNVDNVVNVRDAECHMYERDDPEINGPIEHPPFFSGEFSGCVINRMFRGDTMGYTIKNKIVQFELNSSTVEKLDKVLDRFTQAFKPASTLPHTASNAHG